MSALPVDAPKSSDERDKLLQEVESFNVYERMMWPSDVQFLQFYDAAVAPYGGPIALVPKHPRPSTIDPFLRIFNACGVELIRYNWYDDHVKALGWSDDEELFCVLRDGRIMQYVTHGQARIFYNIFDEDEREDAVDVAKVWTRGLVVITCMFRIYLFNDLSSHAQGVPLAVSFQPHANTSMNQYASALAVIEGHCNRSGQAEVVYALWDSRAHTSSIVVSTPKQALTVPLADLYPPRAGDVNCVVDIAIHDDGKYIAIATVSGSVSVFSSDFKQTFVHMDLQSVTPPHQLTWFGRQFSSHGTLAVAWAQPPVLMLCDMMAGVRWIPMRSNFLMVSEIDGLRVIDKQTCVFYQRLVMNDAGKFLLKIYQSAQTSKFAGAKSDKRTQVLSLLHDEGKVKDGIEELLYAASARFSAEDQDLFLKAATFGKVFVNKYRTFEPRMFKNNAAEVAKQMQQRAQQPNFSGTGGESATSLFVERMRQKAFQVNKIFSESCKRLRLRNALKQPPEIDDAPSGKDEAGSQAAQSGRNNGRIHKYGKELSNRGGKQRQRSSAKKPPCIPLTGKQHASLGEAAIIRRLVRRQNFEFAAQVCNFLSWSKESVLLHWSRAKIQSLPPPPDRYEGTTELTDRDELVASMLSHLQNQGFRCYAHLALAAHNCHDDGLAERMLRKEDSLLQQIGASLLMGNCENALRQAVASGNEQLCLALLLHLKRHQYSNDDAGYMRLLDRVPQAHSYLLTLRRQQSGDGQKLFQLLLREPRDNNGIDGASDWDETPTSAPTSPSSAVSSEAAVERFRDAGDLMLAMAAAAKDPRERLSYLEKALAAFTHPDAPSELAGSAALVKEAMGLASVHITKLPPNMAQLSLYDTIRECAARSDGGEELAASIKDVFHIDNGTYYRLKIAGIAKDHRWGDLQALSKKGGVVKAVGPDGLRIFVKECVDAGAPTEISASFLDRIRDRKQKMNACVDIGDFELAAAIAMDLGDQNMVNVIMSKAGLRSNYQRQGFIDDAQKRDPRSKSKFSR